MERVWLIVSGVCLVIAATFGWRANFDVAFVAATLGVVAWFFSLRDRLRKNVTAAAASEDSDIEDHDES